MRSNSASEVCTSRPTPSSDPTGKNNLVCSVVKATSSGSETASDPPASASPPNQYTAAGITAKLVWIEAITQRPAMRWRTSRSARRSESVSKRSASSLPRPIVFPSKIPETDSDSWTRLEMSASVSCVVFAIRRRWLPTRRVRNANNGISANANRASCQLRKSMPAMVATTVVTFDAIDVAVFVTTFCTPPMSFEILDCTSPVRVRVKNASDRRWRCRKTAVRRSCMTRCPTWLEYSVCMTPSAPVTIAIAMIPPAANESSLVSFCPIASNTRFSRKAGTTPRAAKATIRSRTPPSRTLYGAKSRPMRRRFARRTAGSAERSGASAEEKKNMPIDDQGTSPSRLGRSALRGRRHSLLFAFRGLDELARSPGLDLEVQVAAFDAHDHPVAGLHGPAQQQPRELVLDTPLDRPSERTSAELRVEPLLGEQLDRPAAELDLDPLCSQPARQPVEEQLRDLAELLVRQRTEDDDLVDPVDELRPEAGSEDVHQLLFQRLEVAAGSRGLRDP